MTCKWLLPARTITCIMGFLCIVIAYMFRQSMNYAITRIVFLAPKANVSDENEYCGVGSETRTLGKNEAIFGWDQGDQGIILSSFYWGYIITHIPGGLLSQKIGGKHTAMIGTLICAAFTLLTPWIINTMYRTGSDNYIGLLVARAIVGAGEGLVFPACSTLVAAWIPLHERSIAVSLVYSGVQLGAAIGSALSGYLIEKWYWEMPFYVFGAVSLVYCLVFALICSNDPASHPFISKEEKAYLLHELGELKRRTDLPPTPWRAILTSVPVYAIVFAQMGHTWGLFIVITDLPKYLNDVLRFSMKSNGLYTSLPYMFMWIVTIGSGFVGDYMIRHKHLGISTTRKLYTSIAGFGPAIFIVAASFFGCDKVGVVAMFCLAMGFMGTYFAGVKANCVDIAPNYAGVIMAIANGSGGIMGIIVPIVVGALTPNSSITQWRLAFYITFAVMSVTSIIYIIFASAEVQPWNHHGTTPSQTKEEGTIKEEEEDEDGVPSPTST